MPRTPMAYSIRHSGQSGRYVSYFGKSSHEVHVLHPGRALMHLTNPTGMPPATLTIYSHGPMTLADLSCGFRLTAEHDGRVDAQLNRWGRK